MDSGFIFVHQHKIAISDNRITSVTEQDVSFNYKEYRQKGIQKSMTLSNKEFVRRFSKHFLPKRFVRIRHYGFLSSNWKREKLKVLQKKMGVKIEKIQPKGTLLHRCPHCKTGTLITLFTFDGRGPPKDYLSVLPSNSLNN